MATFGQLLAEARPLLAATPFGASTREAQDRAGVEAAELVVAALAKLSP